MNHCESTQHLYSFLMLLHMDKDYNDHLDLNVIGNEFRNTKDYRKSKFPIFKKKVHLFLLV